MLHQVWTIARISTDIHPSNEYDYYFRLNLRRRECGCHMSKHIDTLQIVHTDTYFTKFVHNETNESQFAFTIWVKLSMLLEGTYEYIEVDFSFNFVQ